jgi:hypothetical protein
MAQQLESRSRMFQVGGKPMKTWNCFVGCLFDCTYCNARKLALTRLKNSPRYLNGFAPHQIDSDLKKTFSPGEFVFIAYMGDISFVNSHFLAAILGRVAEQPHVNFLVCTKNPRAYRYWPPPLPSNLILGVTLETTYDLELSNAPAPYERFQHLLAVSHPRKFISIEPICDFNLPEMLRWVKLIRPEIVEVGADNYSNNLPEPPWLKVQGLLKGLQSICPTVVEKKGLHRLNVSQINRDRS